MATVRKSVSVVFTFHAALLLTPVISAADSIAIKGRICLANEAAIYTGDEARHRAEQPCHQPPRVQVEISQSSIPLSKISPDSRGQFQVDVGAADTISFLAPGCSSFSFSMRSVPKLFDDPRPFLFVTMRCE